MPFCERNINHHCTLRSLHSATDTTLLFSAYRLPLPLPFAIAGCHLPFAISTICCFPSLVAICYCYFLLPSAICFIRHFPSFVASASHMRPIISPWPLCHYPFAVHQCQLRDHCQLSATSPPAPHPHAYPCHWPSLQRASWVCKMRPLCLGSANATAPLPLYARQGAGGPACPPASSHCKQAKGAGEPARPPPPRLHQLPGACHPSVPLSPSPPLTNPRAQDE